MTEQINKWGRKGKSIPRIPTNLCKYSTLKKMEHKSPLLNHGPLIITSFQRVQHGKRKKKSKFMVEKTDKHNLSLVIKVNINGDKSGWKYALLISDHERNIRQASVEEHSAKYLTSIPQNCQGHQKTRKFWEIITAKRSLRRHENSM